MGTRNSFKLRVNNIKTGCPESLINISRIVLKIGCQGSVGLTLDSDTYPGNITWTEDGIITLDMPSVQNAYFDKPYDVTILAYDIVSSEPIVLHHASEKKIRFKFF